MTTTHVKRYALCLKNENAEDLVVRKLYPVIPDERAEKDHHIRVVDESGEDYLYPADYFFVMELPERIDRPCGAHVPLRPEGINVAAQGSMTNFPGRSHYAVARSLCLPAFQFVDRAYNLIKPLSARERTPT